MSREYILRTPATHDNAPAFVQRAMEWAKGTNELHGIIRGILADGVLVESELQFLRKFVERPDVTTDPLVKMLARRIERVFEDGVVTDEELSELREIFGEYIGDVDERKPTPLPLCDPAPEVVLAGQYFCFTGAFASGTRRWCHAVTKTLGGMPIESVPRFGFLVIGSNVSAGWANQSYGRKIESAAGLRDLGTRDGLKLSIIAEDHWIEALNPHVLDDNGQPREDVLAAIEAERQRIF